MKAAQPRLHHRCWQAVETQSKQTMDLAGPPATRMTKSTSHARTLLLKMLSRFLSSFYSGSKMRAKMRLKLWRRALKCTVAPVTKCINKEGQTCSLQCAIQIHLPADPVCRDWDSKQAVLTAFLNCRRSVNTCLIDKITYGPVIFCLAKPFQWTSMGTWNMTRGHWKKRFSVINKFKVVSLGNSSLSWHK